MREQEKYRIRKGSGNAETKLERDEKRNIMWTRNAGAQVRRGRGSKIGDEDASRMGS